MLYKKHLTSLEDLQAERAAIKKAMKKTAKAAKKSAEKDETLSPIEKGIGFLSGSIGSNSKFGPILDIATQFGLPILLRQGAKMGVKRIVLGAAKEVTFGYVKWKAISMAASIIARQIKKRKEKIVKEAN